MCPTDKEASPTRSGHCRSSWGEGCAHLQADRLLYEWGTASIDVNIERDGPRDVLPPALELVAN